MAFYMVGDIKEVQEKADRLAKEVAARKDEGKKVRRGGGRPATGCSAGVQMQVHTLEAQLWAMQVTASLS
jgi:hypothetical protein